MINEFGYDVYEGDRALYAIEKIIPLPANEGQEPSFLVIVEGGKEIRIDPPFSVNAMTAKGVALRDEPFPGMFGGSKDRIHSYWVPVMYTPKKKKVQ